MYANKKTAPQSVSDYMQESGMSFDDIKDEMMFDYDVTDESDASHDLAYAKFEKKMECFSLNTLVCGVVSYKGEGEEGIYFSDDLPNLSVYRGKFIN